MLTAEWDPYDSYTQQYAEKKMCQTYNKPTENYPKDIHDSIKTTSGISGVRNLTTERPKSKQSEFQRLYSEWYTDYRQHHQKTGCKILDCGEYATEHKPQYIA